MSKLREAARDQPCIRCGRDDGTTVGAHYTGVRRLELGGGFGRKVHDMAMAHLCHECHSAMDGERSKEDKWLHSEEFLLLCVKTAMRLWDQGIIK